MTKKSQIHFLYGLIIFLLTAIGFAAQPLPAEKSQSGPVNQLTPAERQAGWKLLFDGKTTNGWRGFNKKEFPKSGWAIQDGCLQALGKAGHDARGGGDIITVDRFNDFDLQFEWRISPGGNSGVKYFITEERKGPIGHEYQLVDDDKNPDATKGENRKTAALYDLLPAKNKTVRPVGEFNQSRILVQGNHVEHWLNGVKVLEYELGSAELKTAIAASKFKNVPGFGAKIKGHILLQDHGDPIGFRNIKIRELPLQ